MLVTGGSETLNLWTKQSERPLIVEFVVSLADRPKVRLPRFLRQRYVARVGEKINLTIPFTVTGAGGELHTAGATRCQQSNAALLVVPQGKPKPAVSWTKNGQALDTKRVNIRSTDRDSILFIRAAEREDSGVYEMCVKVEDFDDKASLTLQIVGRLPLPFDRPAVGGAATLTFCRSQSCRGLPPA